MRRVLIAALVAPLIALSMAAPPVMAASTAKVVVIVGPAGSSTAHYKADANDIVTEARRYTPNVVKVYTPYATWSKVKAAAQGANVLVYLGHGNGWPSIYAPFQTQTKDGFGVDPGTGADSTKTVYYGEEYIRSSIRLAPNSVVLLYHLCYASGNTEPGLAVGSYTDSKERVDNFGAGFIGAGARAVIAEGHPAHPAVNYIRQLFTRDRTMDTVFRSAPTFHNHVHGPYASRRTPGLRYELDPDTTSPSGFYRSIVGDLDLRTTAVVGATLVPTGTNPPDFVVPGAAQVTAADGAGLYPTAEAAADPTATAPETLPSATRLRLAAEAQAAVDGTRIFEVSVLGAATSGFVRATGIVPRDSAPTIAWNADQSAAGLSPNGDGSNDQVVVTTRFSETVAATLVVKNAAGTTVKSMSLTGDIVRFAWDLRNSSGVVVPDGAYTWTAKGKDAWGNTGVTRTGGFALDLVAPTSHAIFSSTAGANGWSVSPVTITLSATDDGSGVGSLSWRVDGGTTHTWTAPVAYTGNGTHKIEYRATDKAGNKEAWHSATVKIDTVGPSIKLPLSGTAGTTAGTWRGAVTVTPAITDATAGVAGATISVDGATPVALVDSTGVTVDGDGAHSVTVTAKDKAGNETSATTTFLIDTIAPIVELPAAGGTPPTVTPNGDGATEQVKLAFTLSEPATVTGTVKAANGTLVRTLKVASPAGAGSLAWDGRTAAGAAVADGRYSVTLVARDPAGNPSAAMSASVDVYAALAAITRSPSLFYPQDADALAPKSTVAFTLLSPATVTIRVLDGTGALVRTAKSAVTLPAGPVSWAWNGKRGDGTWAARGSYRFVVDATNGVQAAALSTTARADAFRLTTSLATAVRGTAITITAVTAEPLSTTPKVTVGQPGVTAWTVTMTKVSSTTWKATITPKTAGTAGTLSLTVKALDTNGGTNSSVVKLALQ